MFALSEKELEAKKAIFTSTEILQQPKLWDEVYHTLQTNIGDVEAFLGRLTEKYGTLRVVFTGAGTSAYVGDTLVPILRKQSTRSELTYEAIATTDIVADPLSYLVKSQPTVLVSFARSGNSPESLAAVELAEQVVDDCFFISITCNANGALAKKAEGNLSHLLVNTPAASHDKGFAMTSSFTCMLYSAYLIFVPEVLKNDSLNQELTETALTFIKTCEAKLPDIEAYDFNRLIFLGSSALGGLTHEAALKCLELNAGELDTYFETSMGFRHGPKSLQSENTLLVLFGSSEAYTKAYDTDMAREIAEEPLASKLVVLCSDQEAPAYAFADSLVTINGLSSKNDNDLVRALLYVIFAQMFALHRSLSIGITPDNPSPSGKVNRVVQGVHIHPFE